MIVEFLVTMKTTAPINEHEIKSLRSNVWWAIKRASDEIGLSEFDDEDNVVEQFWVKEHD